MPVPYSDITHAPMPKMQYGLHLIENLQQGIAEADQLLRVFFLFFVTGELSTLHHMIKVPNEPGLIPNNGLKNVFLSDQSMAKKICSLCQLALTKIPDKLKLCETPALSR